MCALNNKISSEVLVSPLGSTFRWRNCHRGGLCHRSRPFTITLLLFTCLFPKQNLISVVSDDLPSTPFLSLVPITCPKPRSCSPTYYHGERLYLLLPFVQTPLFSFRRQNNIQILRLICKFTSQVHLHLVIHTRVSSIPCSFVWMSLCSSSQCLIIVYTVKVIVVINCF